jgi:predicted small lipoprotein YifL
MLIEEGTVISRADRLPSRLGLLIALMAATALCGCGRKAGLDPPPVASISEPLEGAPSEADPTEPRPAPARPPAGPMFGPDGKPMAPKTGEKKWTPLDWLID